MLKFLAFILLVLVGAPSGAQQAFSFLNKPGGFAVGFRVVEQVDPSRSYPSNAPEGARKPRPIQTAIWYPAVKGGKPMRYDDYLQLLGWDDDFTRPPLRNGTRCWRSGWSPLPKANVTHSSLRSARMCAGRRAMRRRCRASIRW